MPSQDMVNFTPVPEAERIIVKFVLSAPATTAHTRRGTSYSTVCVRFQAGRLFQPYLDLVPQWQWGEYNDESVRTLRICCCAHRLPRGSACLRGITLPVVRTGYRLRISDHHQSRWKHHRCSFNHAGPV